MLSISVQPSINGGLTSRPSISSRNLSSAPFNASLIVKPKASSLHSWLNPDLKIKSINRKIHRIPVAADAAGLALAETPTEPGFGLFEDLEEDGEEVVSVPKPRLVLKFIWMEKNIGLALDQLLPDHGTVPLSPYFFWPRKDAWEELKTVLESKSWISQKEMIILLNQATDIINLWQQSGGNLS